MARVTYRPVAVRDLDEIFVYTLKRWNEEQAEEYLSLLEDFLVVLSGQPRLGRTCDDLRPGLRRVEYESHVVFYSVTTGGVRISRVLHKGMVPKSNMF